jgi:hypothetical protein
MAEDSLAKGRTATGQLLVKIRVVASRVAQSVAAQGVFLMAKVASPPAVLAVLAVRPCLSPANSFDGMTTMGAVVQFW